MVASDGVGRANDDSGAARESHPGLVDQSEAASIFVERPRLVHGARFAVEQECLSEGIHYAPFIECAVDAAAAFDIEVLRKSAFVDDDKQSAGRQCGIPKVQFDQS